MINFALVRKKRKALGLTMAEAAKRAGFPGRQQWNQVENGSRLDPQLSTAAKIADALECSIDELVVRTRPHLSGK